MDDRIHMGKAKEDATIPVAPLLSEMNEGYLRFIDGIKTEIQNQRIAVVLNANVSMICLYWKIGRAILDMQEKEGWGAKVIDRMAADLKEAFPEMSGFSPRNIKYMRKFAECLHKFHGGQILNCLTDCVMQKAGCGTPEKRWKTVGAAISWIYRFKGI